MRYIYIVVKVISLPITLVTANPGEEALRPAKKRPRALVILSSWTGAGASTQAWEGKNPIRAAWKTTYIILVSNK